MTNSSPQGSAYSSPSSKAFSTSTSTRSCGVPIAPPAKPSSMRSTPTSPAQEHTPAPPIHMPSSPNESSPSFRRSTPSGTPSSNNPLRQQNRPTHKALPTNKKPPAPAEGFSCLPHHLQFTCVVKVPELFAGTKSCIFEIAAAVFDRLVPLAAFTFTVNVTFHVAPAFNRGKVQFSVPVAPTAGAVHVPPPAP